MSKILISADFHNGILGRIDDSLWAINIVRQYANKHGISNVIVAGDLFHDRSSLAIPALNGVYDCLKKACEEGQTWYIEPGNHDMWLKTSWDHTSLRVLSGYHTVVEQICSLEICGRRFWFLPFMHFESEYMEALAAIEKDYSEGDILITHIGVNNASLNECFLLKCWSVVNFENSKFKRVYTGHFHCHQQVGENVWYPGGPIPFKFEEGVVDHGFIVYDTETNQHEFIKIYEIYKEFSETAPPDYLTLEDTNISNNKDWLPNNNIRIILTKEYTTDELRQLKEQLKKEGAKTVSWTQPKKTIDAAKFESQAQDKRLGTPKSLFEAFTALDKPNLNVKLLHSLNNTIIEEADERLVVETVDGEI
jgi:DNA repair exonuclease SbcCD nuclease subunit